LRLRFLVGCLRGLRTLLHGLGYPHRVYAFCGLRYGLRVVYGLGSAHARTLRTRSTHGCTRFSPVYLQFALTQRGLFVTPVTVARTARCCVYVRVCVTTRFCCVCGSRLQFVTLHTRTAPVRCVVARADYTARLRTRSTAVLARCRSTRTRFFTTFTFVYSCHVGWLRSRCVAFTGYRVTRFRFTRLRYNALLVPHWFGFRLRTGHRLRYHAYHTVGCVLHYGLLDTLHVHPTVIHAVPVHTAFVAQLLHCVCVRTTRTTPARVRTHCDCSGCRSVPHAVGLRLRCYARFAVAGWLRLRSHPVTFRLVWFRALRFCLPVCRAPRSRVPPARFVAGLVRGLRSVHVALIWFYFAWFSLVTRVLVPGCARGWFTHAFCVYLRVRAALVSYAPRGYC